ncbi:MULTISPECIES: DMT family transporter [unclassified Pseudomonas]|uniref:DMT family transporter n=1 Tax=unclassified Pseudomonas TaxID=196821 RepID=UPI002449017E|nr:MULTISPECIES: DMT family transporter [unclassified Pseudomonas]MDG9926866.1 DMT family transporter [Pseudomonas sp. GD04042]MDH0484683.1 DMT family transporter [Pseudomonas sp. GD04015]MDH0602282.1 DMT family transporter [Pseudomonas sp. GD03869]
MSLPSRSSRPVQGALLLALSALLFSLMGVGIREVSSGVNNESVVFFRNLVGVLFFLPLVLLKGTGPLKTGRLKSHMWRTTYGLAAMYCFFYAIAHLPLADAMLFTYAAPVFTPLLAWWLLKEPLTRRMLVTTAIGLVGVLLVAKPSEALLDSQALIGLAASILAAFAFVSIREMSDTEPAFRIVFYFSLFSALISAVPLTWAWQPLSQHQRGLLLVIGLLATVSQIVMSKAYSLAPPGLIGPFAYLAIVFAGIVAWLRWGEMPDAASLVGAALIFASSLLSIARRKA